MSILIDKLVAQTIQGPRSEEKPSQWYVAKPLFIKRSLYFRLKEAWKVLVGNHAFVYHYKHDELKET